MGRLEGGDAYIASVAAAYELTRDLNVRVLYVATVAPHGRVLMVRAAGTNAEGASSRPSTPRSGVRRRLRSSWRRCSCCWATTQHNPVSRREW